ncbi:MAG: DNA replication/repair protein RecF [Gammaproteobacteria bacterium]|jgi:DNA replication and repair protein RecF
MTLESLELRNFRCFEEVKLALADDFNLIHGENASGKTSLLEAFFFLGRGRSFRTGRIERLMREGASGFELVGRLRGENGSRQVLGMRRDSQGLVVRLGGEPARGLAEVAEALPVMVIHSDVHLLLEGGPRFRRRYLDWGAFHVEQGFFEAWRRYQRSLRQRNELLKKGGAARMLAGWDREVAESGERLDSIRQAYLDQLLPAVERVAEGVLESGERVALSYRRGWLEGVSLLEALERGRKRDLQVGFTQSGPHRAELLVRVGDRRAQDRVSRGQQKVIGATLQLAQATLLAETTGQRALLAIDDLPAELDAGHRGRLLERIRSVPAQVVLTAIEREAVDLPGGAAVFHVEHGRVHRENVTG